MAIQTSSISNFKRFFIKIMLPFLSCCILFGLAFEYVFEKKIILNSETNGSYKVNRIITTNTKNETVILGSSRAEGGFIPSVLGSHYFNYGISGTQDDVMLFFLKEECKKDKQSSIIINFDVDGLSHAIGDVANYIYNSDYLPVKKLIGKSDDGIFDIPFIKYYGYYEYYLKMYLNNKMNLTKKTDHGASLELNHLVKSKFTELVNKRLLIADGFRNNLDLELEFLRLIADNPKRMFIIVISPYHSSFFNKFKNYEDVVAFSNKIKKLENVKVFDFAHVKYPDNLFMNTTHLNLDGAERFSKELRDSINATIHTHSTMR